MKSKVKENNFSSKPYPKMMKHTSGLIVLFHKSECGTVIYSADPDRPVGTYRTWWTECESASFWSDFNGEVTISDE